MLLQLFLKIIAARLIVAAPLPMTQKEFAPEEGVAVNMLFVDVLAECHK